MKKTLIAGLGLGAAAAALAQSSVTLTGLLDGAVTYGTGSVAHRTQLTSGSMQASKLIFRGSEDLGGGASASFWLEPGLNLDTGTGVASNSNNQPSGAGAATGALTFNRRSTVSLASSLGEVRLGRDLTPQYLLMFNYDPFFNNGVGAGMPVAAAITGVTLFRASNSVAYITPNDFGGWFATVQHYRGENPSGTATADDGNGTGGRLQYAGARFSVAAAASSTQYAQGNVKQNNLGGLYDFGAFKLMGFISRDANGPVHAKGALIGTNIAVGAGEIRAALSSYETTAAGNPETRKLSLGYVYNLSRRTALYATAATVHNAGGAAYAVGGAVTAANRSSRGVDFGIRTSF